VAASTLALGFFGEMYRPGVQAAIADLVPAEDRVRAYSLLYWVVNLGFAFGQVLAGLVVKRGYLYLFAGDAATSLAFALVVWRVVPETRPHEARGGSLGRGLLAPFSDGVYVAFLAAQLLLVVVFCQFQVALPVDMRAHGVGPTSYGRLIAINGALIVVVQPFIVSRLRIFRRSRVLAAAALLVGLGFGATGFARGELAYAATIVVWTLGEILMASVAPAVIADLAPTATRGGYQGAYQMVWGTATLLAPTLGSLVLGRLGSRTLWTGCAATGLLAAVGHVAIAGPRKRRLERMREEARQVRAAAGP
jgi:predicted MFS family arabinose efflux permease